MWQVSEDVLLQTADFMFPLGKGAPRAMPKDGDAPPLILMLLFNAKKAVEELWKQRGWHPKKPENTKTTSAQLRRPCSITTRRRSRRSRGRSRASSVAAHLRPVDARMGGSVSVAGCRRRGRGFRTGHMARSAIAICRTVTYGRVRLGIDAGAVRTRLGCIQTLARTVVAALNESVDVCARSSGFIGPFLKKACTLWPVAVAFPSGALAGFPAPR